MPHLWGTSRGLLNELILACCLDVGRLDASDASACFFRWGLLSARGNGDQHCPHHPPTNPQVGQVIGLAGGYPFNAPASVMQCRYDFWSDFHWVTATINAVNSSSTGRTFNANGVSMPVFATGVPGVGFAMMARDPNHGFAAVGQSAASLLRVSIPSQLSGACRDGFTWWPREGRFLRGRAHTHCRALQGAKYQYLSPWVSSGQYAGAGRLAHR